mmetsp:Transcript_13595/g.48723  ORF Transcript_13595/g.48723 Transcript_13595/m.48723 type:complete len:399 (-) Transcript_13595:382-1578(-)
MRGRLHGRGENFLDALPRQRGDVHHRRPLEHAQFRPQRLGVLVHRVRVLVDHVPLVHAQHERAPLRERGAFREHEVLLRRPFLGVDHEDHHLRSTHRLQRAADGELLGFVLPRGHRGSAPNARGVDERELVSVRVRDVAVDRVSRRAAVIAHDGARVAGELIQKRALSDVGPSHDGHLERLRDFLARLLLVVRVHRRKRRAQLVHHVPGPGAGYRAHRERGHAAQRPEIQNLFLPSRRGLALVHREHQRLVRVVLSNPPVDVYVRGRQSGLSVHDHDQARRLAHRERSLGLDHPREDLEPADGVHGGRRARVPRERLQPSGVHHHELRVAPERSDVHPVARDPGLVVHDRALRPGQAVEQRGLADVWPADDGDPRELLVRKLAPVPPRPAPALDLRAD